MLLEVELANRVFVLCSLSSSPDVTSVRTGSAVPSAFEAASQVVLVMKNLPVNAGDIRDAGSIPGAGRPPGVGHGNPLQYSCLENPMGRGAWRATVHEITELDTTEMT